MTTEHDDFVFLVGTGNFRDGVVGGGAFGILLVLNVEAQGYGGAVGKKARNAAVIFIAHHQRGDRAGPVVGGVLLRDDDAVGASCIVDAGQGSVVDEELIDLAGNFLARQLAFGQLGLLGELERFGILGVEARLPFVFGTAHGGRVHVLGHLDVLSYEDDCAANFVLHGIQVGVELGLRGLLGFG